MELQFSIEKKESQKGNSVHYLHLHGIGKYPINSIDVDEKGMIMIKFPCLYIPNEMKKNLGSLAEGYRATVEHMADYGRVEFAEEGEWGKLFGSRRLLPTNRVEERIDGEMAFVWDREKGTAYMAKGYDKK